MRKKTDHQLAVRLYDMCYKWLRLLWLGNFDLTVEVCDLTGVEVEDGYKLHAESVTSTRYKLVTVTGDTETIRRMNDRELDELACHEMLHVALAPLGELLSTVIEALPKAKQQPYFEWKSREVEDVTTGLTNAVRALRRAPREKRL